MRDVAKSDSGFYKVGRSHGRKTGFIPDFVGGIMVDAVLVA